LRKENLEDNNKMYANVSEKPATSTSKLTTLQLQGKYSDYIGSRVLLEVGSYL
jgi:hypothetical protein